MTPTKNWRQSTRSEIQDYYNQEFPTRISDLPDWITPNNPKQYALAFRERYPARSRRDNTDFAPPKDFIRRSTRNDDYPDTKYIEDWDALLDFFQNPAANDPMALGTGRSLGLVEPDHDYVSQPSPVPEAAYYALDNWEQFWVLAFDIDAKDVAKQSVATGGQTYEEVNEETVRNAGIIDDPPTPHTLPGDEYIGTPDAPDHTQEYHYRFQDIEQALNQAFDLKNWLENTVEFDDVRVFYSGQGAHIYAFKDDPYYKFTHQTRRFFTTYIKEKLHIPIDRAITWDRNRVMRVPYSLHTDVNRVVTEITTPDFDFKNNALPNQSPPSTNTSDTQ